MHIAAQHIPAGYLYLSYESVAIMSLVLFPGPKMFMSRCTDPLPLSSFNGRVFTGALGYYSYRECQCGELVHLGSPQRCSHSGTTRLTLSPKCMNSQLYHSAVGFPGTQLIWGVTLGPHR